MKKILFIVILSTLTILFNSCKKKLDRDNKRPNIIFILSDDHAYQAISSYGSKLINTPNIDRIAQNGMLFTNASVTNSICAPSRATILTGKHTHMTGKVDNHFEFDQNNITFPQILQESGYQTALFGKLHFGNNPKGFDEFKILPGQGEYWNPNFLTKHNGEIKVEGYATDIITDFSISWLKNKRDPKKPFLLMYMNKAPHRPWYMNENNYDEFLNKKYPEPKTLFDSYDFIGDASKIAEMRIKDHMGWSGDNKIYPEVMKELGLSDIGYDSKRTLLTMERMTDEQKKKYYEAYDKINNDFKLNFPNMSEREIVQWKYQRYMQDYLGTIRSVDDNIGKLLDYLESENLMDNTIIIYTSDQGFYLGEHGWYDKRFVYDESFKTPLIISWKDHIKPGSKSNELVQNLDFAQTLIECARIDIPQDMQGKSLVPLLEGEGDWNREEVYYHYYEFPAEHMVNRHYAIVTKEYKLIHFYYSIDEWVLIDRKNDPDELINEYNNSKYDEIVKDLHLRLDELRIKYQDNSELSNHFIDKLLEDAIQGKVFGISKEKAKKIILERENILNNKSSL